MSDTTDFRHLTNLSGQNSLKVGLEVGPVEELRWTIVQADEEVEVRPGHPASSCGSASRVPGSLKQND